MRRPDPQELARACLPGEGEVRLERLACGLLFETFLAERDEHRYSVRVARPGCSPSRPNAGFEARVLSAAGREGLAPPLICCDVDRGVLALAWLEGTPWSEESIQGPARINDLAQLARRIHGLQVAPPWRVLGPADWVRRYRELLESRAPPDPDSLHGVADRHLAGWAALPEATHVICHSDLHRLNLLEVGGPDNPQTLLLDWEYAHLTDPLWDLAGWSTNNDFTAAEGRLLLTAYLGGAPDGPASQRFGLLCWLFDYVCLLWISLYLTSNPSGGATPLAARARLLETRLAAAVYGKLVDD